MDTDSISFSKQDGSPFTPEEQASLLQDLNSNFPEKIKWEHDGIWDSVIVLKSKNYILKQAGKVTKKGSSLKSSKTERGLKDFMDLIISELLNGTPENIEKVYHKFIKEVFSVKDISRWTTKVTVTDKVLNGTGTSEQKKLAALKDKVIQPGEKYYMYFKPDGSYGLQENWDTNNPDHDPEVLLKKLYKTLEIFANVIDLSKIQKMHAKRPKSIPEELQKLLQSP